MEFLRTARFWLLVLPFIAWIFCFRFFVSGDGGIIADGVSYFEHIGFFTDHIAKGQYPLWDWFWYDGAPYHFFLRRIGEFNPFYLIIVLLKIVGVSHASAYLIFLLVYYVLAVLGFYLLLLYVLKNDLAAYLGYIFLLFSSWGTQLYYNYIILLFVPLIWFFYFFIRFSLEQRKYQWLGVLFWLGILLTTYIPFYFLTIFSLFIVLMVIFYPKSVLKTLKDTVGFFKKNKLLFILSALFAGLICVPGYLLYLESKAGEFIMPARGGGADVPSAVAVGISHVASGDFINNSSFDKFFVALQQIRLGDFFIPYAFLLLLVAAMFTRLNKLIVVLFIMISGLLLVTITQSSPVHAWLFKYIYFFKFIRNIYYFFWLAILPLIIFWVAACLRSLMDEYPNLAAKFSPGKGLRKVFFIALWLLVLPQSFLVYQDLTHNMKPEAYKLAYTPYDYAKHRYSVFNEAEGKVSLAEGSVKKLQQSGLYFASRWYGDVFLNVDNAILNKYAYNLMYLYDNVAPLNVSTEFWVKLQKSFLEQLNVAYITHPTLEPEDIKVYDPQQDRVSLVLANDSRVNWLIFDPNHLRVRFKLDQPKFLVINNNYNSKWQARVNGKVVKLYRANYAFQGVWLPAGVSELDLVYDTPLNYWWHWSMLGIFTLLLFGVVISWVKHDE